MIRNFYNKTAIIYRPTETLVNNEVIPAFNPIYRIDCSLQAKSGNERTNQRKMEVEAFYTMYCDVVSLFETDIIEIDGIRYEITFVDNTLPYHLQIDLKVIK